ncbi:hypothetical protein CJU89_6943 [Yarrowia sp. B02]|nr:hypothetical protein CJU89_6943 [Yarrowia sp. B02]
MSVGPPVPNWTPRSAFALDQTLQGTHCKLVPLTQEYTEDLFEAYKTAPAQDWFYLPIDKPETVDDLRAYLQQHLDTDRTPYAVIDPKTNKPVGSCCTFRVDQANGVMEIGFIAWSPLMQRTPMSTEAVFLQAQNAFNKGYRRVEWKCDSCNQPSKKAARRLGFQYEGTFRQAQVYKGRNRDTTWFSIIDSEWPELEKGFQKWLSADNFDGEGKQKTALHAGKRE